MEREREGRVCGWVSPYLCMAGVRRDGTWRERERMVHRERERTKERQGRTRMIERSDHTPNIFFTS